MKKLFYALIVFILLLGNVSAISAQTGRSNDVDVLQARVDEAIQEVLGENMQLAGGESSVEINSINFEVNEETLANYNYDLDEAYEDILSEIQAIVDGLKQSTVDVVEKTPLDSEITTFDLKDMRTYYVARVWAGIPTIGWGHINQEFNVEKNGKAYIKSVELLGSSYKTGITLARWQHNRSWYELGQYKTFVNINMRGIYHYVIKGGPLSTAATFKATIGAKEVEER